MTAFETQVAEALRAIPGKQYRTYAHFLQESERERFEFWLGEAAPRVAAAITAAAQVVWDGERGQAIEAAVLAALRGAP